MYKKLGVALCLSCVVTAVFAFEPIPIDEFFKQNPEQVGEQQDFTQTDDEMPVNADVVTEKDTSRPLSSLDRKGEPIIVNPEVVEKVSFKKAEFMVLNRITDKVIKVTLGLGETKNVDGFEIGYRSCNRKIFQDNAIYTAVSFNVRGEPQKTSEEAHKEAPQFFLKKDETIRPMIELYNNHIYLELPGLNGFEHPIYDIRPIHCTDGVHEKVNNNSVDSFDRTLSVPQTGVPVETHSVSSGNMSTPIPQSSTSPQSSLPALSPAVNVGGSSSPLPATAPSVEKPKIQSTPKVENNPEKTKIQESTPVLQSKPKLEPKNEEPKPISTPIPTNEEDDTPPALQIQPYSAPSSKGSVKPLGQTRPSAPLNEVKTTSVEPANSGSAFPAAKEKPLTTQSKEKSKTHTLSINSSSTVPAVENNGTSSIAIPKVPTMGVLGRTTPSAPLDIHSSSEAGEQPQPTIRSLSKPVSINSSIINQIIQDAEKKQ